jgi:hypothetical protein
MPATYILLRNNKQTGPFHLDELLLHGLQPHDLIWIEGQSAGWSHPSEIAALKPYMAGQRNAETPQQPHSATNVVKPVSEQAAQPAKNASHIYVSLPAMRPGEAANATPATDLEAKAEALHQRIQAFAQGRATSEDTDTHPARSLDNMKQEYGTWLAKQEKKKMRSVAKRRFIIAGAVLVVTTSVFGINKWMRSKPALPKPQADGYAARPVIKDAFHKTTTAAFNTVVDSVALPGSELFLTNTDTPVRRTLPPNNAKRVATAKKTALDKTPAPAPVADTTLAILPTPPPERERPKEEVKKVVPLSRLVSVTGTLQGEGGNNSSATQIRLQNNSTETLKTVAVSVTYYKKGNRQLSKETVYFYNVEPATTPVITVSGYRRATAARFEIGTITRADGSLYLIH